MLTILSGIIQHSRDFSTVHRNGVGMTVRAVPYSPAGKKKKRQDRSAFFFLLLLPLCAFVSSDGHRGSSYKTTERPREAPTDLYNSLAPLYTCKSDTLNETSGTSQPTDFIALSVTSPIL